jgi:hypothetical protein
MYWLNDTVMDMIIEIPMYHPMLFLVFCFHHLPHSLLHREYEMGYLKILTIPMLQLAPTTDH